MVLFSLKAKSEYSIKENILILDNGLISMILCMVFTVYMPLFAFL